MYSYFIKYKVQVIISNSWVDVDDTIYRQLIETEFVLCNNNIYEIAPQLLEFAECDTTGGYRIKILDISYLGKIGGRND